MKPAIETELVEVFQTNDELLARTAIDEVLAPAGIQAVIHNRVSHAFPAPASLSGGFFVAVPEPQAQAAIDALDEAQADGILSGAGQVRAE